MLLLYCASCSRKGLVCKNTWIGFADRIFPAQLFRRAAHVAGNGFAQLRQGMHQLPKRARGNDLLPGRRNFFQRQAR